MFCIFHQYCPKSADNGNCPIFVSPVRFNRGIVRCVNVGELPEDKFVVKTPVKVKNALKASKQAAAGK